ncbi:hypothetical protein KUTeg_009629 [Tegillarca granosa]|uniref:Uncharacterized protein n=1 Tax=Tegillarca granosa TaxID=220873 RepID=A0ABQ9F6S5_TEGGR|nr:hypothetical protein KUTeg_009629 [Tegillarca granosa]
MFNKSILITRNPFDAFLAEFNRIYCGHSGYAKEINFTNETVFFVYFMKCTLTMILKQTGKFLKKFYRSSLQNISFIFEIYDIAYKCLSCFQFCFSLLPYLLTITPQISYIIVLITFMTFACEI